MKLCREKCSLDPQPLSNFQRRGNSPDGRDSVCKECRNRQTRLARGYGSGPAAKRGKAPPMTVEHRERVTSRRKDESVEAPRKVVEISADALATREALHRLDERRWAGPKPGTADWFGI